jgi:hypothetical protein
MKMSEIILLAGLTVFSLVLLGSSLEMPYSAEETFGPGFLPLNLSVALLILVGITVLRAVLAARRARPHASSAEGEGTNPAPSAVGRTGVLLAAMGTVGIGILAMRYVGVLPALAVLLTVISWRFAGHSPARSAGVSAITVLAIYGIFKLWLGIPLV